MIVKRKILGLNFEFDLTADNPLDPLIFKIFKFRVEHLSDKLDFENSNDCFVFIHKTLSYLPDGFYIIYEFENDDRKFVQISKDEYDFIYDIPIGYDNYYKGKVKIIKGILKKHKGDYKVNKRSIRVTFNRNDPKILKVIEEITKNCFDLKKFTLSGCRCGSLTPKKT